MLGDETIKENRKVWDIVPYCQNDLSKIGQFFKEHFNGNNPYGGMGYFNWKICSNTTAPGIINLIKDDGKIVAITSLTPKSLFLKGVKIKAGEIGDAYTASDYKGQGMFPSLATQSMVDGGNIGVELIFATPNEYSPSLPVFRKKLNYDVLSPIPLESLSFQINIKSYLDRRLHWTISATLSLFFSFFSYFFYLFKSSFIQRNNNMVVELADDIPSDMDLFWETVRDNYDFIFERDSKMMLWRYISNPNKYQFLTLRVDGKLSAYLVYRVAPGEKENSIIIADYLTLPGRSGDISNLIDKLVQISFKLGISTINTWSIKDSPYFKIFKGFGFLRRATVFVVCYQNQFTREIDQLDSCHFTIGDTDNV